MMGRSKERTRAMRKWGVVISVFYALVVVALLVPAGMILAGDENSLHQIFVKDVLDVYGEWLAWVPMVAVIAGEAALLFLSIDTTFRKLKPRAHIAWTITISSMLFGLLAFAALSAIGVTAFRDKFIDKFWATEIQVLVIWAALWLVWAIVFYFYFRDSARGVTQAVSWLLKGSVLELLIAVPCHIIVRRREDCSAPVATSFGIVTGVAIMLLSFGPSVLLLYKKRLDAYTSGSRREVASKA
jgi:hypothetical protein